MRTRCGVWLVGVSVAGLAALGMIVTAQIAEVTLVEDVPLWGSFYSLQKTNDPPLPFHPFPGLPLYGFGEGNYVYDDRAVDYGALRQQREAYWLLQRAAAESLLAEGFTMESMEDGGPPGPPGYGGGGGTNEPPDSGPPTFLTSTQLCLWPLVLVSSNALSLTLTNGVAGARYDLFLTTNLSPFVAGLNLTNWLWLGRGTAGQTNFTVYNPPLPEGWFRLGTMQDGDGDGLTDAFEGLVSHTAAGVWSNPDTDNDGLPDGWEVEQGLQPSLGDANADPDGDGWTNWGEWLAGSEAQVAAAWGVWVASPAVGRVIP